EEVVADSVGANPVDLLGHTRIPRTQSRFDMCHVDAEFLSRNCTSHGRIYVANDDDEVRFSVMHTSSNAAMIRPVCTPWLPEPTSRFKSGRGNPSCSKNRRLMFSS